MNHGEKLMQLTIEYQESKTNRGAWSVYEGTPAGREPSEIAKDYESTLAALMSMQPRNP